MTSSRTKIVRIPSVHGARGQETNQKVECELPQPEIPKVLTTADLFQLQVAAKAIVIKVNRHKEDVTTAEVNLAKVCENILERIVKPKEVQDEQG